MALDHPAAWVTGYWFTERGDSEIEVSHADGRVTRLVVPLAHAGSADLAGLAIAARPARHLPDRGGGRHVPAQE